MDAVKAAPTFADLLIVLKRTDFKTDVPSYEEKLISKVSTLCTAIQGCDYIPSDHTCIPTDALLYSPLVNAIYTLMVLFVVTEVSKTVVTLYVLFFPPARENTRLMNIIRVSPLSLLFISNPKVFYNISRLKISPAVAALELVILVPFLCINIYYVNYVNALGLSVFNSIAFMLNIMKVLKLVIVMLSNMLCGTSLRKFELAEGASVPADASKGKSGGKGGGESGQ